MTTKVYILLINSKYCHILWHIKTLRINIEICLMVKKKPHYLNRLFLITFFHFIYIYKKSIIY